MFKQYFGKNMKILLENFHDKFFKGKSDTIGDGEYAPGKINLKTEKIGQLQK